MVVWRIWNELLCALGLRDWPSKYPLGNCQDCGGTGWVHGETWHGARGFRWTNHCHCHPRRRARALTEQDR